MKNIRKILSLLLTFTLTLSTTSFNFTIFGANKNYDDVSLNYWAYNVISKWSGGGYNVLVGDGNGKFLPSKGITLGELAVILSKSFGYTERAEVNTSPDEMDEFIEKAIYAGIFDNTTNVDANKTVTREQAIRYIALAYNILPIDGETTFTDNQSIGGKYKPYVNAFQQLGYIVGKENNKFDPQSAYTRAEAMQVINSTTSDIIDNSVSGQNYSNSLIIRKPNVTIKDSTVNENLIIGQGVGDGKVTLSNVTINGSLIAYGGGSNSVVIEESGIVPSTIVNKPFGEAVHLNGEFDIVTITNGSKAIISGTVKKLILLGNSEVTFSNAIVDDVEIIGDNAKLIVNKDSSIENATIGANNVVISGRYTVKNVLVNENAKSGVEVLTVPTNITVDIKASPVKTQYNGYVQPGTTITTSQPVSSGSSSKSNSKNNNDNNSGSDNGNETINDSTAPSITVSKTGFELEDGYIQTSENSIVIKGIAQDNIAVKSIVAINKPFTDDEKIITVSGLENFEMTIPLDIGGNNLTITASDSSNNTTNTEIYIDRLSTDVSFATTVKTTDAEDTEQIYDSIVDVWSEGETTETIDDDFMCVLMQETSPLVTAIKDGMMDIEDIYILPPSEYFVTGFTGEIGAICESDDLGQYPSAEYEIVKFRTPSLDKLFDSDIRIDLSGGIDTENPTAFLLLPDGSQYVPTAETRNARMFATADIEQNFPAPGWQTQELVKSLIPTFSGSTDGKKSDLIVKMNTVIIYDGDGDKETSIDQIKFGGEFGIKDLKYTGGIEWHPNFLPWSFDVLPQQILSRVSYKEVDELKAEYSQNVDLSELVKKMNSGFDNKKKFMGLSIQGVDFSNKISIISAGIRLSGTPIVGRIKSISDQSVIVPFDPILVFSIIMDLEGNIEGTATLTFNKTTSVEKGFNLQKKGFSGAYGSLSNNLGQRSYSMPYDRQLEIFDTDIPSHNIKLEGDAKAKFEVGIGGDVGVMIAGIMPADITGVGFLRAEALLDGSISAGSNGTTLEGRAEYKLGAGARLDGNIRLLVKGFNWSGGLDSKFSWEKMFFEDGGGLFPKKLSGTVTLSDDDRDNSNNPKLSDVSVTIKRTDSYDSQTSTIFTDSDGNFEFDNMLDGMYELNFEKEGYASYLVKDISVNGGDKKVDVVLDGLYANSVTGKIDIADADTNSANNIPLSGANVKITKITGSEPLSKIVTSDSNGMYLISDIPSGIYYINITKEGYIELQQTVTVKTGQTNYYNATLECIPNEFSGEGYASGLVYDVLTGSGVTGLTLDIRSGVDNTVDGEVIKTLTTTSNGSYSTDKLPAGNYSVLITDNRTLNDESERYLSNHFNIKVLGGKTITAQNGAVTTSLNAKQLRIVLQWGQNPWDLDSHLIGPSVDGGRFHTYYRNKGYISNENKMADLDLDDVSSYGPETTTIYMPTDGIYSFYVHNYSDRRSSTNAMGLANSKAYVQIFAGASMLPLNRFDVPQIEGTLWKVFDYDSTTQSIIPVNELYYEQNPTNVGARTINNDINVLLEDIRNNPKQTEESDIVIEPKLIDIQKGRTQQFKAFINESDDITPEVIWDILGNSSQGTNITSGGALTIAIDESSSTLTVKATSTSDNTKIGTSVVTVIDSILENILNQDESNSSDLVSNDILTMDSILPISISEDDKKNK